MDNNELVKGCVKGSLTAQNNLYEKYAGKMFVVCLRYSKTRMDAEDILQDAFIKIFQNIKELRNTEALDAWIRSVMVNTALKHYRKKVPLYVETGPEEVFAEDVNEDLPEEHYDFKDLLKHIQRLAPRYQMVFNLHAIEKLSHKEIAKKLGIREGTSKSQYARARAILKQRIMKSRKTANER